MWKGVERDKPYDSLFYIDLFDVFIKFTSKTRPILQQSWSKSKENWLKEDKMVDEKMILGKKGHPYLL